MLVVFLIDVVVVVSLVIAGRKRLEGALPLLCFYLVLMPIESRFVIPGVFDLGTDRVAILTLLVLFFFRRTPENRTPIPMKRLMYLHIVWAVGSTLYSISVATSIKQLIGQVIEYYLLYYILLRLISDVRTVNKILYAMTAAVAVACIFGVIEAYTYWSVLTIFPSNLWIMYAGPGPLYVEWGRGLRIRSVFPHPILLGDAIAMAIPIVFYLISQTQSRVRKWVLWLSLFCMFWAIYKTSSRGPWIAVAISFILFFILVRNRARKYLVVICVLAGIVLGARPGVLSTISNLYQSTQDSNSPVGSSYQYRDVLLHAITSAVARDTARMFLGYGLGTFREKGLEITFLRETRKWYTCDNNWALFLYETGYGGLFIAMLLLFYPLVMTFRYYWRLPRPQKYLSAVFFICLCEFYFLLLSVAGYNWGQQGFMAWIVISLSVAYPRIVLRSRKSGNISRTTLEPAIELQHVATA
jgi:hypothetical protein